MKSTKDHGSEFRKTQKSCRPSDIWGRFGFYLRLGWKAGGFEGYEKQLSPES
jgi:hypothetical protein